MNPLSDLFDFVVQHYDLEELRTLAFRLGVDFDDLRGEARQDKARELILKIGRKREFGQLLVQLQKGRTTAWKNSSLSADPPTPEALVAALPYFIDPDLPALGDPPFKGLRYFDQSDADLFFGREALTATLVRRLRQERFLAILGASGSGKSSLVRAGLIPALQRGERLDDGTLPPDGSGAWPVHVITPTNRPLEALAVSLTNSPTAAVTLEKDLFREPRSLHLHVRDLVGGMRLLLVVDQFEELFTLCRDPGEREAFVGNLMTAVAETGGPTVLVVTLRADFYAHCAQYERLREALAQHQVYIGRMTEQALRRTVEEPARRHGWTFQSGLVDLVLDEVGDEPGRLPLLSHALLETWKRRKGRTLTLEGYDQAGRVRGAIAKTAEDLFQQRLTSEQQPIARDIFLQLAELGEGAPDTRRRVELAKLTARPERAAEVRAVLEILAQTRLVTLDEATVEIAHEALIRHWSRLQGWIDAEREALRIRRRLAQAATEWQRHDRDESYLYRGARLAEAEEWVEAHDGVLDPAERDFLKASRVRHQQELARAQALARAERERAEEQKRLRLNALSLALATQATQMARGRLERNDLSALLARQAFLFNRRSRGYALDQVDRALRLTLSLPHFGPTLSGSAVHPWQPETWRFIRSMAFSPGNESFALGCEDGVVELWDLKSFNPILALLQDQAPLPELLLSGHEMGANWLSFSPDGRSLAVASGAGSVHLWHLRRPDAPAATLDAKPYLASIDMRGEHYSFVVPSLFCLPIAFSPDGQTLALGGNDGTARLWDLTRPEAPPVILGDARPAETGGIHAHTIRDLAFGPDGETLVSVDRAGNVAFWDLDQPDAAPSVLHPREWKDTMSFRGRTVVPTVALSPDGQRLVQCPFNAHGGWINSWDLRRREDDAVPPSELRNNSTSDPWAVTFSRDGQQLALGGGERDLRIWNLKRLGRRPARLPWKSEGLWGRDISALAFSPDGRTLLSAAGPEVQLWHLQRAELASLVLKAGQGEVRGLAFSPDGERLVACGTDHAVRLWDLRRPTAAPALLDCQTHGYRLAFSTFSIGDEQHRRPYPLAFSPDGRTLALVVVEADQRQSVLLWDVQHPDELPVLLRGTLVMAGVSLVPAQDFLALAFGPHERTFTAIAIDDGFPPNSGGIWQWDLTSPDAEPTRVGQLEGLKPVATISADGRTLAAVDVLRQNARFGPVRLWDLQQPDAASVILSGVQGYGTAVALSPQGKRIAAGSDGGVVTLGRRDQPQAEPRLLLSHQDRVGALAFSADGHRLASGCIDQTIRLWDLEQPRANPVVLQGHRGEVLSVTFSPDSRLLASGGADGTVRLWIAQTDILADLVCEKIDRNLTEEEWNQFIGADVAYEPTCPDVTAAGSGPPEESKP